jgi:hypothetical protein
MRGCSDNAGGGARMESLHEFQHSTGVLRLSTAESSADELLLMRVIP